MKNMLSACLHATVKLSAITGVLVLGLGYAGGAAASAQDLNGWRHHSNRYVALGDSVAAGVGLNYDPNASAEDKACVRSTQAYAAVLQARSHESLQLTNLACSGATTADLTGSQNAGGLSIAPQLDAAFADGTPRLITMTIGANDLHWSDLITQCYVASCDTPANTAAVQTYIQSMKSNLEQDLASIRQRSHGQPPRTILTGYYNPMSTACAAPGSPITSSEVTWVGQQDDALNNALREAAHSSGYVTFAPLDVKFEFKDLPLP